MDEKEMNPVRELLRQALDLSERSVIRAEVDYEAVARAAIRAARAERDRMAADPRVLLTQNEAHTRYGKSVITSLVRRGLLRPYKFGLSEAYGPDGGLIRKAQGTVYYRSAEIERAVEDGNVLCGARRRAGL